MYVPFKELRLMLIRTFLCQFAVQWLQVLGQFLKSTALQAKQFNLHSFQNETLRRIMHMLSIEGMGALSATDMAAFQTVKSTLSHLFTNGAVCEKNRQPPCSLR